MPDNDGLSITDFAKLSRTNRSTLLYYDKIGLLSPMSRKDNSYRYYSYTQIPTVNQIRTCQALGMSLEEIMRLKTEHSPQIIDETYEKHIEQIDREIDAWISAKKLLITLKNIIQPLMTLDENAITVEHVPAEPIVLGGLNDYSGGRNGYVALADFYADSKKRYPDLDLNYPVWGMFSAERIKNGDWHWPDRYYFYNPEGYDKRPAATYAIGYIHGGFGQCGALYERLIEYINANGYEICGPAYEEYPLNQICYLHDSDYLIRLMITVQARG